MLETILTYLIVAGVFFALGGMVTLWQVERFSHSEIIKPPEEVCQVEWSIN